LELKKDPDFLNTFNDVVNDINLNTHIFKGDPEYVNGLLREFGGVHSNKYLKSSSQTTGLNRGDIVTLPKNRTRIKATKIVTLIKTYEKAEIYRSTDRKSS
jgi:hypothetical protein